MADKLYSLRDLLIHELNDLYSAENQIIEALPKLIDACTSTKLSGALQDHLTVTRAQLKRLDQCFKELGEGPGDETCAAMKGIITEGNKLLTQTQAKQSEPTVLDAALIAACQRVEHYEIAAYGCARTFAQECGETKVADLLQQTLDEEGEADKTLTKLAESEINVKANQQTAEA